MKNIIISLFILATIMAVTGAAAEPVCSVYFTGIGCTHCAKVDPILLGKTVLDKNGDLVIIEYEIYKEEANPSIMSTYIDNYKLSPGVPQIIFSKGVSLRGDNPIIAGLEETLKSLEKGNACPLMNGSLQPVNEFQISKLPGTPKIWVGDRILIKTSPDAEDIDDATLRDALFGDYPDISSCSTVSECVAPKPVQYSGGEIYFDNAAEIGKGWLLEWGRKDVEKNGLQGIGLSIIVIFLIVLSIGVYLKEKSGKKEKEKKHKKK